MNNSWQQHARRLLVDESRQQEATMRFIQDHTLGAELTIRSQGQPVQFRRLTFGEIIAKDKLLERAGRDELYRLTGRSPIKLRVANRHLVALLIANQQVASVAMLYTRVQ